MCAIVSNNPFDILHVIISFLTKFVSEIVWAGIVNNGVIWDTEYRPLQGVKSGREINLKCISRVGVGSGMVCKSVSNSWRLFVKSNIFCGFLYYILSHLIRENM